MWYSVMLSKQMGHSLSMGWRVTCWRVQAIVVGGLLGGVSLGLWEVWGGLGGFTYLTGELGLGW